MLFYFFFFKVYWHFLSCSVSGLSLVSSGVEYHPFPKFSVCTLSIFAPLFSLRLIFCSRTTAAALLQSLALIHTSDPPDTLSALPQCTSAPKLSQTHLAFSLSLTSPSLFSPFSFFHMALHRPVSFALPLSFSNSLNFPFLSLYSATACLTKVSPNLPQSPFDIKWRHCNRPIPVVPLTLEG